MKSVLLFGIFDPNYSRSRVLTSGLEAHGFSVTHCFVDPRANRGFKKYFELYKKYRSLGKKFDRVIVAYPGHGVVWLAYLMFGKRIIFDAFVSLYDSSVLDRKVYRKGSFGAFRQWFLDYYSTRLAARVLLDTNAHIDYFTKTFGVPKKKFIRVLVGTDSNIFNPENATKDPSKFRIHFHGTYIALQGIAYIVKAAKLLENEGAEFVLIGSGQERKNIDALVAELKPKNLVLKEKVSYEELPHAIASADVCLGIFGATEKARRVIPNKVYEYAAMGKAIISCDSPAIREVFHDMQDIRLVPAADEVALAQAIRDLKANNALRESLGAAARKLFETDLTPQEVVKELVMALQ